MNYPHNESNHTMTTTSEFTTTISVAFLLGRYSANFAIAMHVLTSGRTPCMELHKGPFWPLRLCHCSTMETGLVEVEIMALPVSPLPQFIFHLKNQTTPYYNNKLQHYNEWEEVPQPPRSILNKA
jgi:hypothetical protein